MNLLKKLVCAGPIAVFFVLFAAPAFAQFEVNPDHFDNQQPSTRKTTDQVKKSSQKQHASRESAGLKSQAKTNTAAANSGVGRSPHDGTSGANAPYPAQAGSTSAKLRTKRQTQSIPPVQHLNAQASPVLRE